MGSRADLYREMLEHEELVQERWKKAITQLDKLIEKHNLLVDWLNENTEGQTGDETPVERVIELLDMYRMALRFYANQDAYRRSETGTIWDNLEEGSYVMWDGGKRARKALLGEK